MSGQKVPKGYKQTEIGVIPEAWGVKPLKELFNLGNGFSFKSEFFSSNGPIILTPGNFKLEGGLYFDDRNVKRYSGCYPESTIFENGDLLVVMTDLTPSCNLLGKPAFVDSQEKILHNQRIGKVRLLTENINKNFLYFSFLSDQYLKKIKEKATGSTVRHTSSRSIYSISLAIPPIAEQKQIARALSDIDALIEALEGAIGKKRQIKQGAMQELLTGKRRLLGFGEGKGYKQTEIGIIPKDWEIKLLGELFTLGNGFSFKSEYFSSNGPIVLTPGNFKLEGGLYFDDRNVKRYSSEFPESTIFQNGDLLVVMTDLTPDCNLLGKPAFVYSEEKVLHNQRIGKIRLSSNDIDKNFLYFSLLSSSYLKKIKEQATGSTVRHTSSKSIYSVSLPMPKLTEQEAIATILSDMDTDIVAIEAKLTKTRQLKQGMMHELLTGRIRLVEEVQS